ncbi:hypothetical protein QLQ12_28890 [Actinoplanes sp. NEAU-A12]|uniref:Uncharacterized protein n=1 Tax=Actinoplanes sandaracinus TaxID=3045177 RepID=A0ABT6WSF4_9ACTN|nr:hypothetical protein [Actinoplanes sandaracinus]MDI6102643.1 hypothetical protein [Actinoplanes sandaracinus]
MPDVEFAVPSQLPPHVVEVEHPRFVDPEADIRGQPGDRVVAGGRSELAAGGQLRTPPGEQLLDLGLGRRDPQLWFDRGPRPVHLVERALGYAAGQVVLSISPADARASTNPASTSVSNPASSCAVAGARAPRPGPTHTPSTPSVRVTPVK